MKVVAINLNTKYNRVVFRPLMFVKNINKIYQCDIVNVRKKIKLNRLSFEWKKIRIYKPTYIIKILRLYFLISLSTILGKNK